MHFLVQAVPPAPVAAQLEVTFTYVLKAAP